MKNISAFDVGSRESLLKYLRQLELNNHEKLKEDAPTIIMAVSNGTSRYLSRPEDDILRRYYEPTIRTIVEANRKKDYRNFARVLNELIFQLDSIQYE